MAGSNLFEKRTAVNRRGFCAVTILASVAMSAGLSGCGDQDPAKEAARWRELLTDMSSLILPKTATPGAADVGVADVVLNAISVGMDDATYDMLGLVEIALSKAAGGPYLRSPEAKRFGAIEQVDAAAFQEAAKTDPSSVAWRKIKGLILLGYYTSEVGASKELEYALVPSRYDPNVPVTAATKALSSDWFAVSFR